MPQLESVGSFPSKEHARETTLPTKLYHTHLNFISKCYQECLLSQFQSTYRATIKKKKYGEGEAFIQVGHNKPLLINTH